MVTTIESQWPVIPTGVGRPDHTVRTVQAVSIVTFWNNAATGAGGTATEVIEGLDPITLFINVSAATNITIEVSPDGINYFVDGIQAYLGAATDIISMDNIGYDIRLTSSAAVTATVVAYGHKVI